eukprot:m.27535 g.27535  ORF g.27535 m.27535 type:complete len:134 (+) comp7904_c0_seq3:249-650(+)
MAARDMVAGDCAGGDNAMMKLVQHFTQDKGGVQRGPQFPGQQGAGPAPRVAQGPLHHQHGGDSFLVQRNGLGQDLLGLRASRRVRTAESAGLQEGPAEDHAAWAAEYERIGLDYTLIGGTLIPGYQVEHHLNY